MPDDLTIADDQVLWRRIHPDQLAPGAGRPSSGAFEDSDDDTGMSVSLAIPGRDPNELLVDRAPGSGVVSLTARQVRALGLTLIRVPTAEDPHHVEVCGNNTKSIRRTLAKQVLWVIAAMPPS